MTGCGTCGGALDDLAVTVTVTFAPGQLGPYYRIVEPHTVEGWALCSACWTKDPTIAAMLASGYLKAVLPPQDCTAFCVAQSMRRGRGRRRKLWSPFQGALGDDEEITHLRCPVCWGPVSVERKEATASG